MHSSNIIIVGGGMTGGMLAILLADQGMRVTVLDASPAPHIPSADAQLRVSTLTEASHWLLRNSGVWQHLDPERVCPYASMRVWDEEGSGDLSFFATDADAEALGWLLENQHLSAALYQAAATRDNLDWHSNMTVEGIQRTPEGWHVLTPDRTWAADLLVGADGGPSRIREWAGLAGSPKDTGHHALVATVHTEKRHDQCARQVFLPSGPLALLPLFGDGQQCNIVWSTWPDHCAHLRSLDDAAFSQALTQATGEQLGQCQVLSPRPSFAIQERHASSYSAPHLVLVGDAAHVIHPLAGQGVNLGLMDAAVLAEELGRARAAGLACHDARILARYERRRRGENLMMQNAMRVIKTTFERNELPLRWLRNSGMNAINRMPPLRQLFVHQALGRGGDVPALARRR